MSDLKKFYKGFTPFFHLMYPNWEASMDHQASQLDSVIRENWGDAAGSILDVSCGIGTQAIGLAKLGYEVTASDLSPDEVARAKSEAEERGLTISFSVADMREAHSHHAREFNVVISCDNAVPHLMTDDDIMTAFRQLHSCTCQGGGCLITVRDYEKANMSSQTAKLYGVREENGVRYVLFQVWDAKETTYDFSMYIVEDRGQSKCKTHVLRSCYNAIGIPKLMDLMGKAGFVDVKRLDERFFQPVIIGTRKV